VVLTLVDITALKAAESEAERLSFIVRSARDAILSKSLEGIIQSWNSGAERIYGYREAEAVGRHISLIVPQDRRPEIDHSLSEVAEGEDVPPFETMRINKDGRLLHMLVSVTPLRSENGDVTGASVIAIDITDRKLAEQRASLAVEQRDRFLAMLSHELRNSLMGMMSANELLSRSDLDEDSARQAQETISRQGKQMARLLEDTLDASRMRYDKVELQRRLIDLREVIEATLDATRPHAAHRSVKLTVDMSSGPVQVNGDASRLQQVIVNLTQNAINHSRDGGRVVLSLSSDDEYAVISVSDEGSGISPEALPQVFEPFFQDAPSRNGGLGLGLSLAQAVAYGHNGRITAESDGIGKGAVFRLYLPLGEDQSETWSGLALAAERQRDHTDVLLIDDEAARESVAILLRKSGYNVTVAKDGAEALALVDDVQPSVALIDIGLPDMSGLEVARRVREKYARKQIRLIALTGYGRQEDREAALEAGCDMHLVKPVEFSTLERVIAYHVAR
jgi:two-component system CheB/CheR fusion protein